MLDTDDYYPNVSTECVEGIYVGAYEGMYTYSTQLDIIQNDAMYAFMMQSPLQWLDLGYLEAVSHNSYIFTDKVKDDHHIILRLMEKQNENGT